MAEIATVYLARAQNGMEPFRNFLRSYTRHPAGVPNQLILVFKGFNNPKDAAPYEQEAAAFSPKTCFMRDFGFDIRAYRIAVEQFEFPYYCFFNSFSEIQSDDWLAKLFRAVRSDGVGLVGASGSSESMYSNGLRERAQLTGASLPRRLSLTGRSLINRICFDAFPNYHLRSNAFIISRETFLRVWPQSIFTKRGAYLFENGKNSLTRRIQRMNLKVQIVGRDGIAYNPENWKRSGIFRQDDQENLLVSDNQTRGYQKADATTRQRLTHVTWGD